MYEVLTAKLSSDILLST